MTNSNKCPLCGKTTGEKEVYCSDCQEIERTSFPEELMSKSADNPIQTSDDGLDIDNFYNDSDSENAEIGDKQDDLLAEDSPPVSAKGKKSIIQTWIIVLLLLMLAAGGTYFYLENEKAKTADANLWTVCLKKNTINAYSDYLEVYADGKFSREALNKIKSLQDSEHQDMESFLSSNSIDSLLLFVTKYPDSPNNEDIKKKIDSLAWLATVEGNTAEAYQDYIDNVRSGRFSGSYDTLAQEKYNYLTQLKTLEGAELSDVQDVVQDFFKSMSNSKYDKTENMMAPLLSKYYTGVNVNNSAVINKIKTDNISKKIKKTDYSPIIESMVAIKDNKGITSITLPVESEVTYSDKKKKKDISKKTVRIELNDKKLIQAIY